MALNTTVDGVSLGGEKLPEYKPASIVSGMHWFLSKLRFSHSRNVVDMLSNEKQDQKDYAYGIAWVASILLAVLLIWCSVLLILRWRGESGGCASGHAFLAGKNDVNGETTGIVSGSKDTMESERDSSSNESVEWRDEPVPYLSDEEIVRYRKRARRTRLAFLTIGVMTIVFACLALVFSFAPINEAVNGADEQLSNVQDIVDDVESNIEMIEFAAGYAKTAINSTNLNVGEFCPNATNSTDILGVNVQGMVTLMLSELDEATQIVEQNMTDVKNILLKVEDVIAETKETVESSDGALWVVPSVLIGVSIVTMVVMLAAILAWQGKSSKRFQKVMTYIVLPLLVCLSIACWVIAIGAATGSIISGDACVGNGQGGPDATIQSVMRQRNIVENQTLTYAFVTAYTNGCPEDQNPTKDLQSLVTHLDTSIATLWQHISTVDSIGRVELAEACGTDTLEPQLKSAIELAKALTAIEKSLERAINTLDCELIYLLYAQIAHDSLCTDVAEGTAWGFLFLLLIGVTTMTLVTLRAVWLHRSEEEQVFDESEVADNMVLNEHEEYLAYISKYKHEWDEYRGFHAGALSEQSDEDNGAVGSSSYPDSGASENGSLSDVYLSDEEVDLEYMVDVGDILEQETFEDEPDYAENQQEIYDVQSACHDENEIRDDISFPSLVAPRSSEDDGDYAELAFPSVLPDLEERDDVHGTQYLEPVAPPRDYDGREDVPSTIYSVAYHQSAPDSEQRQAVEESQELVYMDFATRNEESEVVFVDDEDSDEPVASLLNLERQGKPVPVQSNQQVAELDKNSFPAFAS